MTESAVKLFQERYKPTEDERIHDYDKLTGSDSDSGVVDQVGSGIVDQQTLLAMDEALVNGWIYRILRHSSWNTNEVLNKIAIWKADEKDKQNFANDGKSKDDPNVKIIQENLKKLGFLAEIEPVRSFGSKTERAVKIFQLCYKLPEGKEAIHKELKRPLKDNAKLGVVDRQTLLAMDEALMVGWKMELSFPLSFIPSEEYKKASRAFGSWRDGDRLHAGCDLYAPENTHIYAIADGKIVAYQNFNYTSEKDKDSRGSVVYQIVVDHGDFIANYREVAPDTSVNVAVSDLDLSNCQSMKANRKGKGLAGDLKVGSSIIKGQHIGYVGLILYKSHNKEQKKWIVRKELHMLHLEIYSDTKNPTEVMSAYSSNKYKRRSDLLDPTDFLDIAQRSLPNQKKDK
jgi:peptidoglycan hydrolase-like protein with peptidoglycan-binding domain